MSHIRVRNLVARSVAVMAVVAGVGFGGVVEGGPAVGTAVPPTPDAMIRDRLGFYPGFGDAESMRALEQQLGRAVNVVVQFGGRATPQDLEGSIHGQLGGLSTWLVERPGVLYSVAVPLAFGEADARTEAGKAEVVSNLTRIAAGEFDATYQGIAYNLADAGLASSVIRLGHEFEADWYPWSAQASCEGYINAFRHVVDLFRQVSPEFRFEWTGGMRRFAEMADCAYPGDEYVDIFGMTVFDKGGPIDAFSAETGTWRDPAAVWAEQFLPRLQAHQQFAAAHGKPVAYPEWGVTATDSGAYGGDNPTFVQSMAAWMMSLPASGPGSLLYHAYFMGKDQFDVRLLPQSSAAFFQIFGAAA